MTILSFPCTAVLSNTLLSIARGLPRDLPPPLALQPPADRPGAGIGLRSATPLRLAFARMMLGNISGLTPDDPPWPVDMFAWIDETGLPLEAQVTTHDLLAVGTVRFPEGEVPVPRAWPTPGPLPLEDGETGLGPLRLNALLRLAAACVDLGGLDLLLQPTRASILVVPADLIPSVAWVLTFAARVTHPVPETAHPDAPLHLLVLGGGGGDRASLTRALEERARLIVLTPDPLPTWPQGVEPPDWLGLPDLDGTLVERQIAATWPDEGPVPEAPDPETGDIEDWCLSYTLPPDAGLARLTATDLVAVFSAPNPETARRRLHRRVGRR